jgi:hypothetical protein
MIKKCQGSLDLGEKTIATLARYRGERRECSAYIFGREGDRRYLPIARRLNQKTRKKGEELNKFCGFAFFAYILTHNYEPSFTEFLNFIKKILKNY